MGDRPRLRYYVDRLTESGLQLDERAKRVVKEIADLGEFVHQPAAPQ